MKHLFASFILLASAPHLAHAEQRLDLSCEGQQNGIEIYLSVYQLKTVGPKESRTGTIQSFELSILNKEGYAYNLIPSVEAGTWQGKLVASIPYNGTKYQNHLRFPLTNKDTKFAGKQIADADLVVSPEYTVAKTVPQQNHWDKNWTWDTEVRKHSAVMIMSFTENGGYIPLSCYSSATVNEKRP